MRPFMPREGSVAQPRIVVLLTYALAFVMPSNMGRIALLMPVVLALAEQAGLAEGSRGRTGLALAVGFGTFQLSASILPANVPNLVMAGAAEAAYGVRFAYLPYLLLHAPVLGLLKGAVLPYQASPIVVAAGMGGVPARDGARLCLATATVTFALLVPLDYLRFVLLGQLG